MPPRHLRPARPALALLLLATGLGATAQTAVLSDPDEDELRLLLAPPAVVSRSFNQAAPFPSSTDGACAPPSASAAGRRNLQVVPYSGDDRASVNLAIEFNTGSDALTATSRPLVDRLARVLKETAQAGGRYAVAGHTDATGAAALNLKLSCARALAIVGHLVAAGVPAQALSPYGFGSSKPLEATLGASARNRRVEIRRAD